MAQTSLKDLGWHLNVSAIPELNPGTASANEILKRALDLDLRQIVDKSVENSRQQTKTVLNGPLVVQLQKTLNIAVPKEQSENSLQQNSKRLLLLTLTDGNLSYQAVEMQPIKGLSMDTPPGTKLRLVGEVPIWKGFLQLFSNNVEVLGGNVSKLVSAWELSRQLGSRAAAMLQRQNQRQQTGPGGHGPPTFVPFGQQIPRRYDAVSTDNFRAMDAVSKEKAQGSGAAGSSQDDDAVDEFSEQRQAAIAKALKDHKQKQKPGDDKKLAVPDISQLTIATKPAPPIAQSKPAVASTSDREDPPGGRSFGGRGRRGRAGYEDDYETAAAIGRPSQFRLFDVIKQQPGQEKLKLVAETAAASAPPNRPSNSASSNRRYNDSGDGDGAPRRGGGGHWSAGGRGRGGASRTSYPSSRGGHGPQPPLFREGSAASSRGVDSASPLSDQGGRNGTGRELPPRLKRHQQQHQGWTEESSAVAMTPAPPYGMTPQNNAPLKSHGRSSSNKVGDYGADEDGDDYTSSNRRPDQTRANRTNQPSGPLLPTPHNNVIPGGPQTSLAAMYPPVVTADGTPYNPQSAEPLMAHPFAAGYAVVGQQPPLHDMTPFIAAPFVPGVSSPPPTSQPQPQAPQSQSQPQQQQQQQPATQQQTTNSVNANGIDQGGWRPGTCCLARWNDGGYYPVQIVNIDPQSQTAFVNYYQYNEYQTVPLNALHPMSLDGTTNPAALPQPVVVTMLPPAAMAPPPPQPSGSDLLRQQHQRMMWIPAATGSPMLPPPPPFPGEQAFANRLSVGLPLPDQVVAMMPSGVMGGNKDNSDDKAVEQPENVVPLETAVAAG